MCSLCSWLVERADFRRGRPQSPNISTQVFAPYVRKHPAALYLGVLDEWTNKGVVLSCMARYCRPDNIDLQ